MTKRTAILLILTAVLGWPILGEAQVAGTISGYVRDESGAVIPGAEVKATMVGQQLMRSAITDETGFFNLLAMPRGAYEITAQLTGFSTQSTKAELTAGENLRVDFRMNLGAIQETIVVSGTAALVETRSATMSGLVDDRRVQELPLNGRNVVELASTLPGITDVQASQEMGSTRGGPTMIVHGASRGQNNFSLNGANFTNYSQTAGFNPPPPDAVQEIRVQTSTFSAEFGNNAGAQVTMVTKAGSNQFHGTAWEFHRNDKLNARSFFQPRKAEQKQNQYGASAGGRIVTNKVFFFGAYQQLTNRAEAGSTQAFVPTDAQRLGDFRSTATQIRNPIDPITGRAYTTPSGGACVTGNVIDPACISPVAKNYLRAFHPAVVERRRRQADPVAAGRVQLHDQARLHHVVEEQSLRPLLQGQLRAPQLAGHARLRRSERRRRLRQLRHHRHAHVQPDAAERVDRFLHGRDRRSERRPSGCLPATWASTSTRAISASACR